MIAGPRKDSNLLTDTNYKKDSKLVKIEPTESKHLYFNTSNRRVVSNLMGPEGAELVLEEMKKQVQFADSALDLESEEDEFNPADEAIGSLERNFELADAQKLRIDQLV